MCDFKRNFFFLGFVQAVSIGDVLIDTFRHFVKC